MNSIDADMQKRMDSLLDTIPALGESKRPVLREWIGKLHIEILTDSSAFKPVFGDNWTDESSQCSVCLMNYEQNEDVIVLPCGHYNHSDCSVQLIVKDLTACPECRAPLFQESAAAAIRNETQSILAQRYIHFPEFFTSQVEPPPSWVVAGMRFHNQAYAAEGLRRWEQIHYNAVNQADSRLQQHAEAWIAHLNGVANMAEYYLLLAWLNYNDLYEERVESLQTAINIAQDYSLAPEQLEHTRTLIRANENALRDPDLEQLAAYSRDDDELERLGHAEIVRERRRLRRAIRDTEQERREQEKETSRQESRRAQIAQRLALQKVAHRRASQRPCVLRMVHRRR